jgi:ribosomal protein L12E/L44/L45/RPP1/RPP2
VSTNDPTGQAGPEPSEEEIRQAFEEQMRNIRVEDVLVQTAVTLINLSGRRLGLGVPEEQQAQEKDVEQARTAIEAVRALLPLLPEDTVQPIRDALSQLQMAFAREAQGGAAKGPPDPGPGAAQSGGEAADEASKQRRDEEERAKARSKLWTPPGT